MFKELQWELLESRREQSHLIVLYNILKQNIYFPSEYIPEFHRDIAVPTTNYVDLIICSNYLRHIVILMLTSTLLCRVHQDYGTLYLIKLSRQLQQALSNHYHMIIILDLIVKVLTVYNLLFI